MKLLSIIVLTLLPLWRADAATNLVSNVITTNSAKKTYIVTLRREADQEGCVKFHQVKRGMSWRHALNGFTADLDDAAAGRLRKDIRVLAVEQDAPVAACGQTIPTGVLRMGVNYFPPARIDGIDDRINVDVAVVDTGIQTNHPDLNFFKGYNFTSDYSGNAFNGADNAGHGTHVSGIIGALDNNIGIVGVAPGVRLWAIKVLDSTGNGTFTRVINGLNYIAAHIPQVSVVNMSLVGTNSPLVAFEQAVQGLVSKGVVVVAAAGNDTTDIAGPDGIYGTSDDFCPAALPEVMAVSAMDPLTDQIASFSNFSQKPHSPSFVNSTGAGIDVAAPGVNIYSTLINSGYEIDSGTSMAAPHVTGLVALYIATHGRATNAAGVYAIRQAIIDEAQPQSQWQATNSWDMDTNHEGLAMPSLSWSTNNIPRFISAAKTAQGIQLNFTTVTGYVHTVQYADAMGNTNQWVTLTATNGTGTNIAVTDTASNPTRFFRLATNPLLWPMPVSVVATNIGSLVSMANGNYIGTTRGVAGAIQGDVANVAVRFPLELTGSRVSIPFLAALNPSGTFSFEHWVKPAQTASSSCSASAVDITTSSRNGWLLYQGGPSLNDGNGFFFGIYDTTSGTSRTEAAANITIDTNAWYHVVGVFDGTNALLYVNGVNAAVTALPNGQSFRACTNSSMAIGERSDGVYAFIGDIDEGAFYTNSLTAAQVAAHYQAGTNATPAIPYSQVILNDHPAGYWRFNEH